MARGVTPIAFRSSLSMTEDVTMDQRDWLAGPFWQAARAQRSVVWRAGLAGILCVAAYAPFFGRRNDYPGHFIAGFGGTLLLLSVLCAVSPRRPDRWAVGAMAVAIAIGGLTEATIFRLAIFDSVDFFNQSLGAAIATAAVLGSTLTKRSAVVMGVLSFGFLGVGFILAFS
jgi:hypothetical protein